MTTVIFNFTVTSDTFASERTLRVGQRPLRTQWVAMSTARVAVTVSYCSGPI